MSFPLKEGLRLGCGLTSLLSALKVEMSFPLKEGLRLNTTFWITTSGTQSRNVFSIKRRIATCNPSNVFRLRKKVEMSFPLKEGLRPYATTT